MPSEEDRLKLQIKVPFEARKELSKTLYEHYFNADLT